MVNATRSKHIVGAHYGLADWLAQRFTAGVMILYTLYALGILLWHGGLDHAAWRALFANQFFRVASFLFMLALLYHAWVGMRNITMDYVKPLAVRLPLQGAIIAALVAYAGWTIGILWGGAR
jgi:succinate dehydrogenase / fumarate reductase, membrane anchor subunit